MNPGVRQDFGVFISYSHHDRSLAEMLAMHIREIGYQPWIDFAGIRGGDEWKKSIETALEQSTVLVVMLTPEAVESEWVQHEIQTALNAKQIIIPLMFRNCSIPANLQDKQYLDFRAGFQPAFKHLQHALLRATVNRNDKAAFDSQPLRNLVDEVKAAQAKLEGATDMVPKRPRRGLVVEDFLSTQEIIRDLLVDLGLEVDVASTRSEATALIRKTQYDFITLDMQLGPNQMDIQEGIFVLDLIKRYQGNVPVVMITEVDWNKTETRDFFVTYGIKDMLDKPIRFKQLNDLRELVKRHVKDN